MNSHDVIELRHFYSSIGLWPSWPMEIDPESWLRNFRAGREKELATALLDSFLYFNHKQTAKMFASAFNSLAVEPVVVEGRGDRYEDRWENFRRTVRISYPTGDISSPSDSGHIFVRQLRQDLEITESQLHEPSALVNWLSMQGAPAPIVFVDDFAGSGDQFIETWSRTFRNHHGKPSSLAAEVAKLGCSVFYTPAVCTHRALDAIRSAAPGVVVKPAYLLSAEYSVTSPNTILVPSDMIEDVEDFVISTSSRIGISPIHAFGWGSLGLALAFEHSVPDATLPIFHSENNGWHPLRKRR